MNCPICTKPIDINAKYFCRKCWYEHLTTKERMAMYSLEVNHQSVQSKIQSILGRLKANAPA